jgi:hypothetical protein
MRWEHFRVFDAFVAHTWIEPGEMIADELLIHLPIKPEVMEVKMRLVLARWGRKNIASQARRIFSPAESTAFRPSPGRQPNLRTVETSGGRREYQGQVVALASNKRIFTRGTCGSRRFAVTDERPRASGYRCPSR